MRLHQALREVGVSSAFVSINLTIDFNGSIIDDSFFCYTRLSLFQRGMRKLGSIMFPSLEQKLKNKLAEKQNTLSYEILSLPYSSYELNTHPLVQEADCIHLHWVSGILDYTNFFATVSKPVVWTLHDMNPFLGLFHYKADAIANKQIIGELDTEVQQIKIAEIQKFSPVASVINVPLEIRTSVVEKMLNSQLNDTLYSNDTLTINGDGLFFS